MDQETVMPLVGLYPISISILILALLFLVLGMLTRGNASQALRYLGLGIAAIGFVGEFLRLS